MRPRNRKWIRPDRVFVLALVTVVACKTSDSAAPLVCTVNGISIVPDVVNLTVGGERLLVASMGYSDCPAAPSVVWDTEAPLVAVVTGNGTTAEVLATGPGVAVITATASGASNVMQATVTVNVAEVSVAQVTIHAPQTTIGLGQMVQLTAEPRNASGAILEGRLVTWSSTNTNAVEVDPTGTIEGVGLGMSTITATSEGKSASVQITVLPVAVGSVTVSPDEATLQAGQGLVLDATARDQNGAVIDGRVFAWDSSVPAVASVDQLGNLIANAPGVVTITASTGGVTGDAMITVNSAGDPARFAWASVSGIGVANVVAWYNGKGPALTSVRLNNGNYQVTFPGLGDAEGAEDRTAETVIVSAWRTPGRQCGIGDWTDNGTDLVVDVLCTDASTAIVDSDFNILVVGRSTLANPSAFLRVTMPTGNYAPDSRWAWNSSDLPMFTMEESSSRTLDFGIANGNAAGYLVTPTIASTAGVCALFGIPDDSPAASVRCFAPNGLIQPRLFTALMLRGGHVQKANGRYGFVRVTNPSAAETQIAAPLAGSSSGGTITATRLSQGYWRVRFAGLAGPGSVIALLSPLEQPYAACHVESWGPSGTDLDAFVRCHDAAGLPKDHRFSLVVIE